MTPAMKSFTRALCTPNKIERTYFLTWLSLRLCLIQTEKQKILQEFFFTNLESETIEDKEYSSKQNSNSFCPVSKFEEENEVQPVNTELQVSEQHGEIFQEDFFSQQRQTQIVSPSRPTILSKWQCRKLMSKMKFQFKSLKSKDLI